MGNTALQHDSAVCGEPAHYVKVAGQLLRQYHYLEWDSRTAQKIASPRWTPTKLIAALTFGLVIGLILLLALGFV
jgi:hypothetical protein